MSDVTRRVLAAEEWARALPEPCVPRCVRCGRRLRIDGACPSVHTYPVNEDATKTVLGRDQP